MNIYFELIRSNLVPVAQNVQGAVSEWQDRREETKVSGTEGDEKDEKVPP